MELSLIIPAYNEEDRIIPTLREAYAYLLKKKVPFEILVIDDGSSDNTIGVLSKLKQELPALHIIPIAKNKGKGNAVRKGMLAAKGNIRVFADADGSTPIEELDKLLLPLSTSNANITIGSRYITSSEVIKAQSKTRIAWSRTVNRLVQGMLLPGILDTHCGFKAFTSDAAERVFSMCTINGWSFDLEVLTIARRLQMTIVEVPVKWANDERSKGKLKHLPREVYSFFKIKRAAYRSLHKPKAS
ncbi:MAG: hypothetical protein K0R82_207 [Flavipsychrobacter sp.]|jgi:glycosyltransferase involved in cell wall biosynthesis|nr:hypothetical protein [Flavipsychrobacter sp.]